MRLHDLAVTAFGPFAGTERVDFDALAAAGLFLFTGATGAGKTSILDAVCFALYGQVPGARQQARSLRSDHAAPGVRPEVVLEVTLRERRLRVTRSPAWDRPKLRGSGTTAENAKVLVEEQGADGWVTLTTRLDEAGPLLGGLLGLSLAQFCQVVLLPQGQFAEFLRADADRRRDLLESLFDTGRFAAVESWLVARRQHSARAVEAADRQVAQVLARAAEAADAEMPEDLPPEKAPAWLGALQSLAGQALAAARADGAAATVAATDAAVRVAEAERVLDLQRRAVALQTRLAELTAAQADRDAAVAELEAARQVAPLVPLLEEAGRLQSRLEQARAQVARSRSSLATHLPSTGTDGPLAALVVAVPVARGRSAAGSRPLVARDVVEASRSAVAEAAELRRLVDQERDADELARATDSLERRAVEIQASLAKAAEWLASADERRAVLAAARDTARDAESGRAEAAAAADRAALRAEAATRRDELAAEVAAARDLLRVRTDQHQDARDLLQAVREQRLAGMAAELASGLRSGHDCPVCGSPDHPRPAQPVGEVVTREAEQRATLRATQAEAARAEASTALGALEVDLAATRTAAGGDAAAVGLGREHARLREVADRVAEAAAGLPVAEQALAAFDQEREGWLRQQVGLDEEARGLTARIREQQERVARLLTVVSTARGGDPTVTARAERLETLAEDLSGLADQLAEVERLDVAVAEALERAESGVRARRFDSVEAVAAAVRDEARIQELDALRQGHDAELSSVTEQLGEPDLVAAAALAAPDLDHLRTAARAADRCRGEALATTATTTGRVRALDRLQVAVVEALAERAPVVAAHRLVDHLSRLAEGKSGDNRLRMSLSAYVLAARLEQVAVSASHRLLRMSSGRYSLLHTAQAGTGRGRGGLQLRVLDAWTGQERDPATLSGGESFSASLALALGLADVVTAEAGGALLETLFVDEGFGSLDDDTLDEVMGVLDELRDGGRTVGIVSHVSDLRQRIPVQLRVEKGRHGSVVRQ